MVLFKDLHRLLRIVSSTYAEVSNESIQGIYVQAIVAQNTAGLDSVDVALAVF